MTSGSASVDTVQCVVWKMNQAVLDIPSGLSKVFLRVRWQPAAFGKSRNPSVPCENAKMEMNHEHV